LVSGSIHRSWEKVLARYVEYAMAIIAVDFDETLITKDENGFLIPVDGAQDAMCRLKAKGHRILIHTCRIGIARQEGSITDEIELVTQVLNQYQIPYDQIFLGEKLVADLYIDDRAVVFDGDWDQTVDSVIERTEG